jgi:hypothetical protein
LSKEVLPVSAHRAFPSRALALVVAATAAAGLLDAPMARGSVAVSVEAGAIQVRASGSELNVVDVRYNGLAYIVRDATSAITAGPGCIAFGPDVIVCGGEIGSAVVAGSEGPDVIDLSGIPVPVEADGGAGDDALQGGGVRNTLSGGAGVDQVAGAAGDDLLKGGDDDDLLVGRKGKDVEFGGIGDDILQGGAGSGDTLFGDAGADLLEGGAGVDTLVGAAGDDVLAGGAGVDDLTPGSGDDAVLSGPTSRDTLNCPSSAGGTGAPPPTCAAIDSGAPPEIWPPTTAGVTDAIAASSSSKSMWPFEPGRAHYVKVHIEDSRRRPIRVCIRTVTFGGRVLRPYTARTTSRFYPKVFRPRPPRRAAEGVARRGRCHR